MKASVVLWGYSLICWNSSIARMQGFSEASMYSNNSLIVLSGCSMSPTPMLKDGSPVTASMVNPTVRDLMNEKNFSCHFFCGLTAFTMASDSAFTNSCRSLVEYMSTYMGVYFSLMVSCANV